MLNGVKKIKFKDGANANRSLMRKWVNDFIRYGKLEVSVARAKAVKAAVDRLVHKAQENKNSDNNMMLRAIGDKKLIATLVRDIAPKFNDRQSGFVTMKRLGRRLGDGAEMARLEWVGAIGVVVSTTEATDGSKEEEKTADSAKKTVAQKTALRPARKVQEKQVMSKKAVVAKPSAVKKRGDR